MNYHKALKNLLLIIFIHTLCIKCDFEKTIDIEYSKSGDTVSIFNLDNKGNRNGEYKLYYPENKLKEIGSYKNGKLYGIKKSHFENGNIKEYEYYDSLGTLIYLKRFDLSGNIIYSELSMISPKITFQREIEQNDSLLLSYKLLHSMIDDIYLKLKIRNTVGDSLIEIRSDSTIIEYYLKGFKPGWNNYLLNIYEINKSDRNVIGEYRDSISIYAPELAGV